MKCAVQQIMLGSLTTTEEKTKQVLRQIKAANYDGIELNGFMIRPTSFLVKSLTKFAGMPVGKGGKFDWVKLVSQSGLSVVSIHEDLGSIKNNTSKIVEEAHMFQTKNIVITGMYRFDYSDLTNVQNLASELNQAGKELSKEGINLFYHNHNCEFQRVTNNKTAYEIILEETCPDFVSFEFDSYWPTEAGVDSLALMKKLGDRMKLYHICDRGIRSPDKAITPILKSDSMELGYGNMNLVSMVEQAKKVNVEAIVLETHKNWIDKSPMKSIQLSGDFLMSNAKQ